MAVQIGPRIGIDGEEQYRKDITKLIQQGKTLDAQMRAVGDSFATEAEAQEAAAEKAELLQRRIEAQRKQVELLAKMVEKSTDATEEGSSQTLQWEEALANATAQLHRLEASAQDSGDAVEGMGEEMDGAGSSALSLGDLIKANLTSEAIIAGLEAAAKALKKMGEALVATVRDSAAYADNILTLSTNTGLSTDTLQEFQYMAELTDTSVDTITGSLAKLTKQMGAAKGGSGSAAEAFAALGVSVTDSNGELRDNEQVFYDVIDALGRIPNATERDAAAMEIFGKSAQDLNSLIAQGSDGIAAFAEEAHRVGYVLDSEALNSLGAADDGFQRMQLAVESAKNRLGLALAPVVTEVSERLLELAYSVDWDAVGAKLSAAANKIIAALDWILANGETIAAVLGLIGASFLAFTIATNPIAQVIAAVVALGVTIAALLKGTEEVRENIVNTFRGFVETIGAFVSAAASWGRDLVQNFINGIFARAQALWNAARNLASGIAAYLHFSTPDKGPLADLDQSPKDMLSMYARGIDANAWRVEDAVAALATTVDADLVTAPAPRAAAAMNYGGFTFNIYGAEGQSEEELADAVMDRIQDAIDAREAVFA